MFKYLGSKNLIDKRKIENHSRKTNEEEDITLLIRNSSIFGKIIESLDPSSPSFLDNLHKEVQKRLQIHSLRCKICKMRENGHRVNCKVAFILINIEEGL